MNNPKKYENEKGDLMLGKLKSGKLVEVKRIVPDWNQVEAIDGTFYYLWEFEIIYNSEQK